MDSGAPAILLRSLRGAASSTGLAIGVIMRLEMLHRGIDVDIVPLLLLYVLVEESRAFSVIAGTFASSFAIPKFRFFARISAILGIVEVLEVVAVIDRLIDDITIFRRKMLGDRSKRTIRKRLDDDLVPMLDRAGIVIDVRPIIIFIIAENGVVSMNGTLERGL